MKRFLTVVASLPALTISVAVTSSDGFLTEIRNGACSSPGPYL